MRHATVRFRSPMNAWVRSLLYVWSGETSPLAMMAEPRTRSKLTRMDPRSEACTTLMLSFIRAVLVRLV